MDWQLFLTINSFLAGFWIFIRTRNYFRNQGEFLHSPGVEVPLLGVSWVFSAWNFDKSFSFFLILGAPLAILTIVAALRRKERVIRFSNDVEIWLSSTIYFLQAGVSVQMAARNAVNFLSDSSRVPFSNLIERILRERQLPTHCPAEFSRISADFLRATQDTHRALDILLRVRKNERLRNIFLQRVQNGLSHAKAQIKIMIILYSILLFWVLNLYKLELIEKPLALSVSLFFIGIFWLRWVGRSFRWMD